MRKHADPLFVLFFLSGFSGLIYESVWTHYVKLFLGHAAYAQTLVLVIFVGGLAVGSWLCSRFTERIARPLLWYAVVEGVIGVMALGFHAVFVAATTWGYDTLLPATCGGASTVCASQWALSALLLAPQSILLGATFPLMSAAVIRLREAEPGHDIATLYFLNSLGAVLGVLAASFTLVPRLGLPGTLLTAGLLNLGIALVAYWLSKGLAERTATPHALPGAMPEPPPAAHPVAEPGVAAAEEMPPRLLLGLLLATAMLTGLSSFIYEIAWIRMLSLVLGSATHSFELMLSAFILGLALGAFWVRTRADHFEDPVRVLGYVQWAMGLLAVATLPLYLASFEWMAALIQTVQANENGYRAFLLTRYALALLVMLPATFCAGMTLPLITRVLMRSGAGEPAIGAVYAINTLGSIGGVILAGLVLMPALGLKLLLLFGAVIDIGLGVWLVARTRRTVEPAAVSARLLARLHARSLALPVAVTGAVLIVIALASRFDLGRLTSGVYRHGVLAGPGEYSFLYYKDGRTATVSMRRSSDGFITLATNGKPDASMDTPWMDTLGVVPGQRMLTRDIATQLLLPLITLAHAPDAQHMAVIGHGSGMSSHVLLGSSRAREVVTIEIEPEMIEASRHFRPANRRVFDDERSKFVIDDAKAYFASSGRTFDLILSEPSNPWVSGVSGLFTVEFYDRVRRQLAPHGVFGQWLHLYELSDGLVTSVLAAIDSIFPAYEVYFTSNSDILVVAANDTLTAPDWNVTGYPGIAWRARCRSHPSCSVPCAWGDGTSCVRCCWCAGRPTPTSSPCWTWAPSGCASCARAQMATSASARDASTSWRRSRGGVRASGRPEHQPRLRSRVRWRWRWARAFAPRARCLRPWPLSCRAIRTCAWRSTEWTSSSAWRRAMHRRPTGTPG
jgi:spermidine synthase